MKKLLIAITLVGTFIPAVQGLPAEVKEKYEIVKSRHKYEELKALIQNADALAFESKFTPLPAKYLLELERLTVEAKKTIRFELSAMGAENKSLFMLTKGILGCLVAAAGFICMYDGFYNNSGARVCGGSVNICLGIMYASDKFRDGCNYKQYLQDKLINLDAIAAHIAYEKTLVPVVSAPVRHTLQ